MEQRISRGTGAIKLFETQDEWFKNDVIVGKRPSIFCLFIPENNLQFFLLLQSGNQPGMPPPPQPPGPPPHAQTHQ